MAFALAGLYGPEGVEFPDGRPARSLPVSILNLDGTPAALYTSKDRLALANNPVHTDQYGNLIFFAEPGEYRIVVNSAEIPIQVPIHPNEPTLGAGGTSDHPFVDWYVGEGVPTLVVGAGPGDMYIDTLTGTLYQLR